jgi:hypothetical protein
VPLGGSYWSCGCWQGAEPLPAGEKRVLPGPVRADLQDAHAGLAGRAGGDVPDPERVGVGFPQVRVVVEAEEAGPGGQVGGDVGGEDPAGVDLSGLRCGSFRRALAVRTPPVSTTVCSRWVGSGKTRPKFPEGFEVFWCDKNGDRNAKGEFIAVLAGSRWRMIFTCGELAYLGNAIGNFQRIQKGGGQPRWILAEGFETNRRKH